MKQIIAYPSLETLNINGTRSWSDDNNYKYYIEEKIDGSQLSILCEENGSISFYNKNKLLNENNPTFMKSICMLKYTFNNQNILNQNYIYHGESICKLKHNVIVYDRTPKYYFICYDIFDIVNKNYLSPELKKIELDRVGIECTRILFYNDDVTVNPYEKCKDLINQIESNMIGSCLGGSMEGIVLKHHAFNHKNRIIATKLKYVTKNFKERHQIKQSRVELSPDDFLKYLGQSFCTEARFHKSYQHLVEQEQIDSSNISRNDLDKIITELNMDFDKEYKEEVMMTMWAEFSPMIKKFARENVGSWFINNLLNNK